MVAKAFVDTNVLLRAMIPQMQLHQECETLLQQQWDEDVELWINRQVIREYLVQVTRPGSFEPVFTIEQIMQQMEMVATLFRIADETAQVTAQLFVLLKSYPTLGKQIHDANLVATMLANGMDRMLTLNIEDMKRFSNSITLVSPLSQSP